MKHFVFKKVLFTIGKEYNSHVSVSCQWQNYNNEVCEIEILVDSETIEKVLEGDAIARESFLLNFTYYLMNSYNPSVIS